MSRKGFVSVHANGLNAGKTLEAPLVGVVGVICISLIDEEEHEPNSWSRECDNPKSLSIFRVPGYSISLFIKPRSKMDRVIWWVPHVGVNLESRSTVLFFSLLDIDGLVGKRCLQMNGS